MEELNKKQPQYLSNVRIFQRGNFNSIIQHQPFTSVTPTNLIKHAMPSSFRFWGRLTVFGLIGFGGYTFYSGVRDWYYEHPIVHGDPPATEIFSETKQSKELNELLQTPYIDTRNTIGLIGQSGSGKSFMAAWYYEHSHTWFRRKKAFFQTSSTPWLKAWITIPQESIDGIGKKFFEDELLVLASQIHKKSFERIDERTLSLFDFSFSLGFINKATIKGLELFRSYISPKYREYFYFDFVEKAPREETLTKLRDYLEKHPGWLIALDSIDDLTPIEHYLPTRGGILLLTSNNKALNVEKFLPVEGIEEQDAKNLLRKHLVTPKEEELEELMSFLGSEHPKDLQKKIYLPVALSQACGYIKEENGNVKKFIEDFQKIPLKIFGEKYKLEHIPASLAQTLKLSLETFRRRHKKNGYSPEERLLMIMSIFAPLKISELQLKVAFVDSGSDEASFIQARHNLVNYGLIEKSSISGSFRDYYTMHQLKHSLFSEHFEKEIYGEPNRFSWNWINYFLPELHWLPEFMCRRPTLLDGVFNAGYIENTKISSNNLAEKKMLYLHMQYVIDHMPNAAKCNLVLMSEGDFLNSNETFLEELSRKCKTPSLIKIAAKKHHSFYMYNLSKEGKLEIIHLYDFKTRKASDKINFNNDDDKIYFSKSNNKIIYDGIRSKGGYLPDVSKKRYHELLYAEFLLTYVDVLDSLYNLPHFLREELIGKRALDHMSYLKNKKHVLKEILPIFNRYYRENDLQLASIHVSLGSTYLLLRKPKQAKGFFEHALPIFDRNYQENILDIAAISQDLGNVYGELGKLQEQKELLERAFLIFEKHYGGNHPTVAVALMFLGNALVTLGKSQQAKEYLERALRIQEHYYGENHPQVAMILSNSARLYTALGDFHQKKVTLQRALSINKQYYGENHPKVAVDSSNLGNTYILLDDFHQAKELLEFALKIFEEIHGVDHFIVAGALTNLGHTHCKLRENEQAKEYLERALIIKKKYYGEDSTQIASTLTLLGDVYCSLGNTQHSKVLLEHALRLNESQYGKENTETATTLFVLAKTNLALNDPFKALTQVQESLTIFQKTFGLNHKDTIEAKEFMEKCRCKCQDMYLQAAISYFLKNTPTLSQSLLSQQGLFAVRWMSPQKPTIDRGIEPNYGKTSSTLQS